ncbi:MAG: hypothetical protein ABSH20_29825, partial [Tepidisphaeraceae bacterium]
AGSLAALAELLQANDAAPSAAMAATGPRRSVFGPLVHRVERILGTAQYDGLGRRHWLTAAAAACLAAAAIVSAMSGTAASTPGSATEEQDSTQASQQESAEPKLPASHVPVEKAWTQSKALADTPANRKALQGRPWDRQGTSVRGRVVAADDGKPLAWAMVYVSAPPTKDAPDGTVLAKTLADREGRFQLDYRPDNAQSGAARLPENGQVTFGIIKLRRDAWEYREEVRFALEPGKTKDMGELKAKPAPPVNIWGRPRTAVQIANIDAMRRLEHVIGAPSRFKQAAGIEAVEGTAVVDGQERTYFVLPLPLGVNTSAKVAGFASESTSAPLEVLGANDEWTALADDPALLKGKGPHKLSQRVFDTLDLKKSAVTLAAIRRAAALKEKLDHLTIEIRYHGNDKAHRSLFLHTASGDVRPPFGPAVRIEPASAAPIIDQLLADGFLARAEDWAFQGRDSVWLDGGSVYAIRIRSTVSDFHEYLGWDLAMLRRLEGLRKAMKGEAAKEMDKLLAALEPQRKEWEKASAATEPPAAGAKVQKLVATLSNSDVQWDADHIGLKPTVEGQPVKELLVLGQPDKTGAPPTDEAKWKWEGKLGVPPPTEYEFDEHGWPVPLPARDDQWLEYYGQHGWPRPPLSDNSRRTDGTRVLRKREEFRLRRQIASSNGQLWAEDMKARLPRGWSAKSEDFTVKITRAEPVEWSTATAYETKKTYELLRRYRKELGEEPKRAPYEIVVHFEPRWSEEQRWEAGQENQRIDAELRRLQWRMTDFRLDPVTKFQHDEPERY